MPLSIISFLAAAFLFEYNIIIMTLLVIKMIFNPIKDTSSVIINPFVPTVAFNICCPRDCPSRHNGGTAGAPLKPLRDDSALRALSSLRGTGFFLTALYTSSRFNYYLNELIPLRIYHGFV